MEANTPLDDKPKAAALAPDGTIDYDASAPPKHFLRSKTFWIAVLGLLIAPLLKKAGVAFDDGAQQETAETIVKLLTLTGVVWARSQAQGPLHFGLGLAPVLLMVAAVALLLGGCAQYRVRGGVSWTNGEETVTVTTDGKQVILHGGANLGGSDVGADFSLPLPRRHGLAK